jgi:hypothetical protein
LQTISKRRGSGPRGSRLGSGVLLTTLILLVGPAAAQESLGMLGPFGKSDEDRAREEAVEEIRRKARVLEKGTSSSEDRARAVRELPLGELSPADRQRVDELLGSIALFRKLPTIGVEVDHRLYQFFVTHPDVAVGIWRAMQISEFEMTETRPRVYDAAIGDGTEGEVEVIYSTPREQLVFCTGRFKPGPLIAPITGRTLLYLRTEFVRSPDGRTAVKHRIDMFVAFPSTTVETAAKVLSPVSYGIIDRNFHEVSLFLHMMTLLSTQRPAAVDEIAARLDGVSAEKREALKTLAADVHARARQAITPPTQPPLAVRPVSGTTTP